MEGPRLVNSKLCQTKQDNSIEINIFTKAYVVLLSKHYKAPSRVVLKQMLDVVAVGPQMNQFFGDLHVVLHL